MHVFVGIQNRGIPGCRGIRLLRCNVGDEMAFITIMLFDSIDAFRYFAGEDYEAAVVPPQKQGLCC